MKIQCPECAAIYTIDESKIPEKGGQLRCKKCQGIIKILGVSEKKPQEAVPDMLSEEAIIEQYVKGKDEDGAIEALYEGIQQYAEQKKFAQAEKLREKLIDIAPMALTQIISSEEMIEKYKYAAIDMKKLKLWSDLFETLSQNEINDLYFLFNDLKGRAYQPLFEQGQYDDRLYFIRSGRLKLTYFDNEKKESRDIAILEKGDIAGEDTFFSFTNHTTTLMPMKDSDVYYLKRSEFDKILDKNPSIKAKLSNYCKRHKKEFLSDHSKNHVRRTNKRHQVNLKGIVQKIDRKGQSVGDSFNTTIVDISVGGLCFMSRNLKTVEAADIHKSWIKIITIYGQGPDEKKILQIAKVVAVDILPFEESAIHVQFRNPLSNEQIQEITKYSAKR